MSLGKVLVFAVLAVFFALINRTPIATAVGPTTTPTTINFQGKVVNGTGNAATNGTNVTDGTYTFVFKLYTVSSAGTAIWTETDSLTVAGGVFQVPLGATCSFFVAAACNNNTPIDFSANPALYLGITFNSDPNGEMSPRPQLQSVPFAFNSDKVGGLTVSQLVQLSPSGQQAGFLNVGQASTFGSTLSVGGAITAPTTLNTINGLVINGGTLTNVGNITGAGAVTIATTGSLNDLALQPAAGASLTSTVTKNTATGNEVAYNFAATINKATSGNYTGIKLNVIQTSAPGVANLLLDLQVAGVSKFSVSNGGSVTQAAALIVQAGGASISGGLNNNSGGITLAGSIAGATTIAANSTLTLSGTGANELAISGAPINTATVSLVQIGGPIASGNVVASGGTYIGLNAPLSGAGSAADFVNLQINGVSKFKVTNTGALTSAGALTVAGAVTFNGLPTATAGTAVCINAGAIQNSGGGTCALSSIRYKNNVQDYTGGLDVINELRPVSFNYNQDNKASLGFIAEEVVNVDPRLVFYNPNDPTQIQGVEYHEVVPILTKAVQQLNKKLDNIAASGSYSSNALITPHLTSSGALLIDSGSTGDVTIDTGSSSNYVSIGATKAASVDISAVGKATKVKGSLAVDQGANISGNVDLKFDDNQSLNLNNKATNAASQDSALHIDNANASQQVTSAVKITNSGGAGYNSIISSPNFSVSGNGDIAAGSLSSKGNFILLDASNNQVVNIDTSGTANFNGNLSAVNIAASGALSIGGDANFAGLSSFQKLATFFGKTIFRQDVSFEAHITVASDSAGYATLRTGETKVHVSFKNDYESAPLINVTIVNGQFAQYSVSDITPKGFDISIAAANIGDITMSWTAVGATSPQTATNPVVAPAP